MRKPALASGVIWCALALAAAASAQPPAPPAGPGAGPPAAGGPPAGGPQQTNAQRSLIYPPRPVDAAAVERGKLLFAQNGCAACHGADIRGGSGPALHRRKLVLNDVRGEKLGPFLSNGAPGMNHPTYKFEPSQIVDIADFLHNGRTLGTGTAGVISRIPSILTGSATAGKVYFDKTCTSCHSATGDLKGIATRVADPRALQQRWLSPPPTKPITAVVRAPGGNVSGDVTQIDEFQITLKTAAGERVIQRNGVRPAVVLTEPLAAHRALLRRIADKDIHDVTAYLVILK